MSARLTDEDRRLRAITEAAWQAQVISLARANGWRHYHPPKAGIRANGSVRETVAGFPDLLLLRGPRLVFAELKRQIGPVRPEQQVWLRELAAASAEVYLWRPSDLPDVVHTLRRTP